MQGSGSAPGVSPSWERLPLGTASSPQGWWDAQVEAGVRMLTYRAGSLSLVCLKKSGVNELLCPYGGLTTRHCGAVTWLSPGLQCCVCKWTACSAAELAKGLGHRGQGLKGLELVCIGSCTWPAKLAQHCGYSTRVVHSACPAYVGRRGQSVCSQSCSFLAAWLLPIVCSSSSRLSCARPARLPAAAMRGL